MNDSVGISHLWLSLESLVIGAVTGLVISAYRGLLEGSADLRTWLYRYFTMPNWYFFALYCLLILFFAFILYRLVKREPLCSGSGIPQIKGIIINKIRMNWLSVLLCKFIGGVLAIGAGLSLGREGPSVQLGAALAQGIGEAVKPPLHKGRHFLLISGACAGLTAAFNAPLAGIIFAFEELYKQFSPSLLLAAAAAAVSSDAVTDIFFGTGPIFHAVSLPSLPPRMYILLLFLGIFTGFLGMGFNLSLFKAMDFFAEQHFLKKMWKPAFPLFFAVLLGFILPQVLGGGNQLVDILLKENYSLIFLCLLYLVKLLFTAVSFGSGVPGGIFLPMLVLGAVGGSFFAHAAALLSSSAAFYTDDFIIFAMAAYFSAVVKSPLTGSVLIMEMSGSFEHILALLFVSLTAYITADFLNGRPIYDVLLERSMQTSRKNT